MNLGWSDGRRVRKYYYADDYDSVQKELTVAKANLLRGAPVIADRRRTVGTFLDEWVLSIKSSVRIRTFEKYDALIRKHLVPHLGRIKLEKMTPSDVQRLLDLKLASGVHPRTVLNIRALLSYALNDAIRWGLLTRNSAALVRSPKIPRQEMKVWTEEQARTFLDCCSGKRLGALYTLALFTGMRRGELCALRWSDLDLDGGVLTVARSLQRTCTKGLVFEEPKTAKGRRSISLAPVVVAALRSHRKRQLQRRLAAGPSWKDQDLTFSTGIGTPLDPRNLALDYDRMIEKAEVPRIRFHDLRHTFATIGLAQGVHPKVMSDMLGHAKVSMTLDTYSHALPKFQTEAADKIADALVGAKSAS
jgi:integrase